MLEKLASLKKKDPEEETMASIIEVKLALNLKADKEELYWAQRARSNWLSIGDHNTSYFHRLAT